MVLLRTILSYHLSMPSKLHTSSKYFKSPLPNHTITTYYILNCYGLSSCSSILVRPFSLSAQFERKTDAYSTDDIKEKSKKKTKRLDVLFREAVGLSEKVGHSESDREGDSETKELKQKLRKLEDDVRNLKENRKKERETLKKTPRKDNVVQENEPQPNSLYALFSNRASEHNDKSGESKSLTMEDSMVYKELSPDMETFARHLYKEGYFNDANFLPRNKFDVACFENSYGRNFIQFAAEKFGKDNQEIAKWLSGSDLKRVALFGCPSLSRKNVFSAKQLRSFFRIQEDLVCSKCTLKQSCKFANQSVWKGNNNNVNLAVVMRIITLYALDSVPPQLVVPEEMKASVSKLLKEVLNLSRTVSRGF